MKLLRPVTGTVAHDAADRMMTNPSARFVRELESVSWFALPPRVYPIGLTGTRWRLPGGPNPIRWWAHAEVPPRMSLETIVIDPSRLPTTLSKMVAVPDLYALPDQGGTFPQIAWADSATGERWLGLGAADRLETNDPGEVWSLLDRLRDRLTRIDAPPKARAMLRYFGGIAFDPAAGPHPDWPAGTAARFVLPQVLLRQTRPDLPATVAMIGDPEGAAAILRSIRGRGGDGASPSRLTLRRLESAEERPRWEASVREAIRRIDPSAMRKIVLSRDLRFTSTEPIDAWALFSRITRQTPHGVQFCFRFDGDGTLIGATPERLVGLDGRRVDLRLPCRDDPARPRRSGGRPPGPGPACE